MSAIRLNNVTKHYGRGGRLVSVLENVSFDVPHGAFVALTGPSGAGKTTILNLIGGLDGCDSGIITVAGQELGRLSSERLTAWRSRNVGLIFQSYSLLPMLSAAENVELPLLLTRQSAKERRSRVGDALVQVGLADRADHCPGELSGGQQQRVAIARALVGDAPLLLCDEPTGDLDRTAADGILALLQAANRLGRTIIMVTHDPYAASHARQIWRFENGRLVGTGAIA